MIDENTMVELEESGFVAAYIVKLKGILVSLGRTEIEKDVLNLIVLGYYHSILRHNDSFKEFVKKTNEPLHHELLELLLDAGDDKDKLDKIPWRLFRKKQGQ